MMNLPWEVQMKILLSVRFKIILRRIMSLVVLLVDQPLQFLQVYVLFRLEAIRAALCANQHLGQVHTE